MNLAYPKQDFKDWLTQQWVILRGRKIDPNQFPWLAGPFGNLNNIGDSFIAPLANEHGLNVNRNTKSHGLISPIDLLNLSPQELEKLSDNVIKFYERTSEYNLNLDVKWNPFFKVSGILLNIVFSKRINQLNIPTKSTHGDNELSSEIITLTDPKNGEVKYTIWYRTFKATGQVVYSGIYSTCTLDSGQTCVKAVFPLPRGNATVILKPSVGENGELILESAGKKFGDAGFYFLLHDSKGVFWSQYIKSFRDQLIVKPDGDNITAVQTLTLWKLRVLQFIYKINLK